MSRKPRRCALRPVLEVSRKSELREQKRGKKKPGRATGRPMNDQRLGIMRQRTLSDKGRKNPVRFKMVRTQIYILGIALAVAACNKPEKTEKLSDMNRDPYVHVEQEDKPTSVQLQLPDALIDSWRSIEEPTITLIVKKNPNQHYEFQFTEVSTWIYRDAVIKCHTGDCLVYSGGRQLIRLSVHSSYDTLQIVNSSFAAIPDKEELERMNQSGFNDYLVIPDGLHFQRSGTFPPTELIQK